MNDDVMGENDSASRIPTFLVGLGIGALLGILFAPQSGEETREMLKGKLRQGLDQAKSKGAEMGRQVQDAFSRGKNQLSEAVEAGKQTYYETKNNPI
jgi:gas vesicle protein